MGCWSLLGPVEIAEAAEWVMLNGGWNQPAYADVPQRIFTLPPLFGPIIAAAMSYLPKGLRHRDAMLSRMKPGQNHGMHVDTQTTDLYVTRVHVPLLTTIGAWMMFEDEGEQVHFEAGQAYTFDTNRRHAFGNNGPTERVHLLFDVIRN